MPPLYVGEWWALPHGPITCALFLTTTAAVVCPSYRIQKRTTQLTKSKESKPKHTATKRTTPPNRRRGGTQTGFRMQRPTKRLVQVGPLYNNCIWSGDWLFHPATPSTTSVRADWCLRRERRALWPQLTRQIPEIGNKYSMYVQDDSRVRNECQTQ